MLKHTFQAVKTPVVKQTVRKVSAVPSTGKKPPTLEEFDPLNPGEWQLGAGGKILPRLPEGTRCGKLVMGKYGLYSPELRKRVEAFQRGLEEGKWSENATPFDAKLAMIGYVGSIIAFIWGLHNCVMLIYGEPLWPATYWIKKKD